MEKDKYLSNSMVTIALLAIMYSFGTFGFLNFFGLRDEVQLLILGFVVISLIGLKPRFTITEVLPIVIFFTLLTLGAMIRDANLVAGVEALLNIFIIYILSRSSTIGLNRIARALVITTSILCLLILIAWLYFILVPNDINNININIYDSTVGSQQIYPKHFMEWLSFSSGDGFQLFGNDFIRLKGYSNEPSATIVHYLAPAVFCFFLGGNFVYIGIFILAVNIFCITSFISILIVALSLLIFVLHKISKDFFKISIFFIGFLILFIINQLDLLNFIISNISSQAMDSYGFNFFSKKIGENLTSRALGMTEGLSLILTSPFGYSTDKLGPGAGLIYVVSCYTGWIGLIIFSNFLWKFFKNSYEMLSYASSMSLVYSFSLVFSIIFFACFISGYGWGRPPAVILFFMYFQIFNRLNYKS